MLTDRSHKAGYILSDTLVGEHYTDPLGTLNGSSYFSREAEIAVLIDGGHLRVYARSAQKNFVPDYIEKVGLACALADEVIHRILYYDCRPYEGTETQPVSGTPRTFTGSHSWLNELAKKDLFAIRTGVLKFRGFTLKRSRIPYTPGAPLTDADFEPKFEQKGVDMRIGLDMATLSPLCQHD